MVEFWQHHCCFAFPALKFSLNNNCSMEQCVMSFNFPHMLCWFSSPWMSDEYRNLGISTNWSHHGTMILLLSMRLNPFSTISLTFLAAIVFSKFKWIFLWRTFLSPILSPSSSYMSFLHYTEHSAEIFGDVKYVSTLLFWFSPTFFNNFQAQIFLYICRFLV